jgi:voltage-gated potassium channel Kch
MNSTPLILVVGGDTLTQRVCAELESTVGHEVRVVWPLSAEADDELLAAGVQRAVSILTLSSDDALNLAIALRARMLNPKIRIVLRQFNPWFGEKIERNLANCSAISPAAHSAATYAGAALDATCFFGLRFPSEDGPLLGFTQRAAVDLGIVGATVREAEERLRVRILAFGTRLDPPAGASINPDDIVVTFGPIHEHRSAHIRSHGAQATSANNASHRGVTLRGLIAGWNRLNPVLRLFIICATLFFSLSLSFFHFILQKSWIAAGFYVAETMTNVGFGDTSVITRGALITGGAIVAMLGGIVFTSIFIGYVSSAMTRAQWISMQGLRRIRAHGHVVICGGGKIGTAVMNLLTAAGKRVVVIEPDPDANLVRRARERDVDLLTGDANRDNALDLCEINHATAVLALTDNDAVNLEIALGARARSAAVPIIVRIENDAFAEATSAVFKIATFSPAALTAPALAGLSRFPGTRGRVRYANDDYTIGQRKQGLVPERPPAEVCTPLCVWRDGGLVLIHDFDEMRSYDELLFIVPLGQFRRRGEPRELSHRFDIRNA